MTSDEESVEGWIAAAWAWIKSRPATFLYGLGLGFVIGAVFF